MHSIEHQVATRSILHPTNQQHDGGLQMSEYGTMIESADVVRLCMELGMTKQDVRQLQKGFNEEDCDHADAITLKSFFFLIHEERRVLTQALLHLAVQPGQEPPTRRLTFDEYLRCVVTFSSFTEGQVFHFFFQLYADITKQRTASTRTTIGEDELHQFSQDIQVLDAAFAHNIQLHVMPRQRFGIRRVLSIPIFTMTSEARDEQLVEINEPKNIKRAKSVRFNQIAVTTTNSSSTRSFQRQATMPSSCRTDHQDSVRSETLRPMNQQHEELETSEYGTMIKCADVARLCMELGMTYHDIQQLRKEFDEEDCDHTDSITLTSFFFLIREEQRVLTKALLRLAVKPGQNPPSRRLTFDEYLRCIVTFSSFTEGQVFRFFFQIYTDLTKQRRASATVSTVGEDELFQFSQDLQVLNVAFARNIKVATSHRARSPSSASSSMMENWTFADFERFTRQHRVAFYPLIRIQYNVRHTGGHNNRYWVQRAREREAALQLVEYMKRNHGLLPSVPWQDRIANAVLHRPTTTTRVHERAKKLYTLFN
ncbi:hypothetical protein Poli38472_008749 [Pythium oligandrum]|uniref:EF-hand domain-containing protein n=1 Tax=Pythium oligandrum TaxID=41045 RepID=A0A8K1FBG4_PYTOL|nr:hypothetical protein Poli38472_008749 [Pythium oligandrum]|eukprot:TMW56101.1 hypothetical protein Poli38472_008749 [Pythium oligandrum]